MATTSSRPDIIKKLGGLCRTASIAQGSTASHHALLLRYN
jgi:hypothetical protein